MPALAASANNTSPTVIHLRPAAPSQAGEHAPSQARNPVAAAPAVVAVIMHCAHIPSQYCGSVDVAPLFSQLLGLLFQRHPRG